jgi:prevent-host-death family protein
MAEVSIRDLRNHGGAVIERVARGERLIVTRDGHAVAELRPLGRQPTQARLLVERWSRLPRLDPARLRQDIDRAVDAGL